MAVVPCSTVRSLPATWTVIWDTGALLVVCGVCGVLRGGGLRGRPAWPVPVKPYRQRHGIPPRA
ncbi:hypothetical protein [Ornithinimicrobium sp. CNJ-824]|uniref:hypothetical protein n=1 Tax=Ornithinimicrobium sp. CNJ-824 TaxID=1904966 RepID=UPI00165139DC|nr:hypothetical protein [Ornithinimicrobium sp. CNJ-824]